MYIRAQVFLRDIDTELYKVLTVENVGVKGLTLPLENLQDDYEILQVTIEVEDNDVIKERNTDEENC